MSTPKLSKIHQQLVLDFLQECQEDGVQPERLPYQLSQFLRSASVQANDASLLAMADDPEQIQKLIEQFS